MGSWEGTNKGECDTIDSREIKKAPTNKGESSFSLINFEIIYNNISIKFKGLLNKMNSKNPNPMHECEQMVQMLIQQTTHSYHVYEQLKQQEQKSAMQFKNLISKERQAIQTIHSALQSHQQAISEMERIVEMYKQITTSENSSSSDNHSSSSDNHFSSQSGRHLTN